VRVRWRRPTEATLAELLVAARDAPLTYAPVGCALDRTTPAGFRRHRWRVVLPDDAFDRATEALDTWAVHRGAGIDVVADGAIAPGTAVAMSAPLPLLGFVDASCRIVAVIDEPDRHGFTYGTLPRHPEIGEEAFVVVRGADVRFTVEAVSRHADALVRLARPIADRVQDRAARRYLDAMSRLVTT